ncbi:Uncharacterised protein [uncultured archaeon]|nr:Uncharacterised protein [uncultured archaeon]
MHWGWKRLKTGIGTYIGMGSTNISLNDTARDIFKRRLMRKGESFSQTVIRLGKQKDITRCFGLLKDEDDDMWKAVFDEMERVRKYPLRGVVK